MHTFLTVTATGTSFGLTVAGHSHGAAFKHAQRLAEGCNVKHEAPPNQDGHGLAGMAYAHARAVIKKHAALKAA